MKREPDFVAADLDVLLDVLRVNDSMEAAAHSVKLVERLVSYPIRSLEDIQKVFASPPAKARTIRLGRHTVTLENASRFLRDEGTSSIEDRDSSSAESLRAS
jgi:hypothetical protein